MTTYETIRKMIADNKLAEEDAKSAITLAYLNHKIDGEEYATLSKMTETTIEGRMIAELQRTVDEIKDWQDAGEEELRKHATDRFNCNKRFFERVTGLTVTVKNWNVVVM